FAGLPQIAWIEALDFGLDDFTWCSAQKAAVFERAEEFDGYALNFEIDELPVRERSETECQNFGYILRADALNLEFDELPGRQLAHAAVGHAGDEIGRHT